MGLHFIPFHGHFLVYSPLKRLAFVGNQALVTYLKGRIATPDSTDAKPEIEEFLEGTGFWLPDDPPPSTNERVTSRPGMAVLLMTNRCNLACTYCYAAAGSRPPVDMPWPMAQVVIDAAVANAQANGDSRFGLSFHGGGEPTLNWDVLVSAVSHARAQSLPCDISLASNGMWAPRERDFICSSIGSVTLSFDGVQAVQDAQRPGRSRQGSFDAVLRNIHALDDAKVSYGIRMTATASSIDRLADGVRFLCDETGVKAIQVEVSFTAARGAYRDPSPDDAGRFVSAFLQAARIGRENDVSVSYSGARPWVIARAFCLAPTQALIATPEGRLVACFEAAGDDHPYAPEFTIGQVTSDGIVRDTVAYDAFKRGQEVRRAACGDCFCFWHCCGDCASRAMVSAAPDSVRCNINREITKALIAEYIERDGGVWTGQNSGKMACSCSTEEQ